MPKPRPPLRFAADLSAAGPGPGAGSVRVRDLVEGANGSGKSTLHKILAGRITPHAGDVQVSARRVGLLTQDVDFPEPGATARATLRATGSELLLGELGLIHLRDVDRPVGLLSEGQQRRLALAIVIGQQPELLLLDEPTNHLSLALVEEVEAALARTPVTVIVASHDRWLRERWVGPRELLR